jgi:hypothetical protein
MCVGIPTVGASCSDGNQCTTNDRCKVVIAEDGQFQGMCIGDFEANLPCNDYDYECTINDRSVCF